MTYNITRNYDTDYSRTDVRTIAANAAKELADAAGYELPTKTVFEEPEIINEDKNEFELPVRPTVTEAGFEPEDLLGSVNTRGTYIKVLGMASNPNDRDTLRVRVVEGESNNAVSMQSKKELWENIHA